MQTCFFPLHFPAPSTTSGTVLEERERTVAPQLSSSGSTEGAFALCHIPHSSQPLCTNTFTCALLLRGRGACPITTTAQSPCPDQGQPSCSSRACPGPLPRSGHVPGQLGHCNAPVQEAQAVLSPPGHPRGAASCPIPDRLGPAVGALVNKAFPVHGGHGQWQSLVPAGSSLCSTH